MLATFLCIPSFVSPISPWVRGRFCNHYLGNQLSNALTRSRYLNSVTHRTGAVYNDIFFRKNVLNKQAFKNCSLGDLSLKLLSVSMAGSLERDNETDVRHS